METPFFFFFSGVLKSFFVGGGEIRYTSFLGWGGGGERNYYVGLLSWEGGGGVSDRFWEEKKGARGWFSANP